MLESFQSLRAAHQSKLSPDVLERLHAQDKHEPPEHHHLHNHRDNNNNLFEPREEANKFKFEMAAPRQDNSQQWWLKCAVACFALACIAFLMWKGCLQVGVKELTIDDVPDDDLYEAFEPEVAKDEMQKRFARRQRNLLHQ